MTRGDCDLCGEHRQLFQVWYLGYMETWGCAQCLDREDEEDIMDDKPEHTTFQESYTSSPAARLIMARGWTFALHPYGGWVHPEQYDDDGRIRVFDSAEDVCRHYGISGGG